MQNDATTNEADDAPDALGEDLVALLKGELSPEREAEVRALIERDEKARAEFESLRDTLKVVAGSALGGMIEPSAAFRQSLQKRIQQSVEQNRRSARMRRPGSTGVQLPRVPHLGEKKTDAPVDKPTESISDSRARAGLGSSTRRAHTTGRLKSSNVIRLSERRERDSHRPTFKHLIMAAAMVMFALTLARFVIFPAGEPLDDVDPATLAMKRWNERREAPSWEKMIEGTFVEVRDATDSEILYLAGHYSTQFNEDCVVGYSDIDLESMEKRVGKDVVDQLVQRSFKVTVTNGKVSLPPLLLQRFGGAGSAVTVLATPGRMEIWNSAKFDAYLRAEPKYEAVPPAGSDRTPDESGLPPEAERPVKSTPTV